MNGVIRRDLTALWASPSPNGRVRLDASPTPGFLRIYQEGHDEASVGSLLLGNAANSQKPPPHSRLRGVRAEIRHHFCRAPWETPRPPHCPRPRPAPCPCSSPPEDKVTWYSWRGPYCPQTQPLPLSCPVSRAAKREETLIGLPVFLPCVSLTCCAV